MPPLSKRRATEPGEATAKAEPQRPKKKARANASQRRAIKKSQAEKLERETEELRVAMSGEPKPDPIIPGFEQPLTHGDMTLVKQAKAERWPTDPKVMQAILLKLANQILLTKDPEILVKLVTEYRHIEGQNQRDEIANIHQGGMPGATLTDVQRRAITIALINVELGKRDIPGIADGDDAGGGVGVVIPGDYADGEGGD